MGSWAQELNLPPFILLLQQQHLWVFIEHLGHQRCKALCSSGMEARGSRHTFLSVWWRCVVQIRPCLVCLLHGRWSEVICWGDKQVKKDTSCWHRRSIPVIQHLFPTGSDLSQAVGTQSLDQPGTQEVLCRRPADQKVMVALGRSVPIAELRGQEKQVGLAIPTQGDQECFTEGQHLTWVLEGWGRVFWVATERVYPDRGNLWEGAGHSCSGHLQGNTLPVDRRDDIDGLSPSAWERLDCYPNSHSLLLLMLASF